MSKVKRIQWHDKTLDRYHKYDADTNELLTTKMSEGPYLDIEIVKSQPIPKKKGEEQPKRKRKRENYLANKDLMIEFKLSKAQGKMTDKFAHMLMLLVQRISQRHNFVNYTYIDDMRGYALMMLMHTWDRFDPERSSNLFSYYTTSINRSKVQFLNQEKKQRNIRDELRSVHGQDTSFNYQYDNQNTKDE